MLAGTKELFIVMTLFEQPFHVVRRVFQPVLIERAHGGTRIAGWRAHQVPISMGADESKHLPLLEQWLRSYKPEELFNEDGTPVELIASFPPKGEHRMGANPHANGGLLLRDLRTPDFRDYAVDIPAPGEVEAQCR